MKLSVLSKSFRLPFGETLRLAKMMGFDSLQLALDCELEVDSMNREKTDIVFKMLGENGLGVSAYCCDLGGGGLDDSRTNSYKLSKAMKMIDLAHNTRVGVVAIKIGTIPIDRLSKAYSVLSGAVKALGDYAQKCAVTLVIEADYESVKVLSSFVEQMPCSVKVNLVAPPNLEQWYNMQKTAFALRDRIGHVQIHQHLCDAALADEGKMLTDFFATLKGQGYDGYIVLECTDCDDPLTAIANSKKILSDFHLV